ncbi:hypothetical protein BCR39DRAFT_470427 [Naematelia encephala]|uniref:Phosphatidic acid phosphatase type 2/haloperoxidase domain-containing protein n=1 Tax=Naematelia encephala TaxID=71784 RepID=A0A1Y2AVJ2_9TREE|nr:hypothetical protein BCR39DRAFT_470427 [Naematelia encephala]
MFLFPFSRLLRASSLPIPTNLPTSPQHLLTPFILALTASLQRLDLSRDPRKTLNRLSKHKWTVTNTVPYLIMAACASFSLYVMTTPPFPLKLGIPAVYILAILIPITSQFVFPATPIFAWLITFFSARFIPSATRPDIHVALLPALESVLYGANISDLQTRYTNAVLDVLAWLPYGVLHFSVPFVVALVLWTLGPRGSVQYWGKAFGWMNLTGVVTQLVLPCAAPWYEIIHGLTPANYGMPGSPGGLLRIDRVFHSSGYTNAFGSAPLVFGAFPSLHSGCATMEALFLAHFFPQFKPLFWAYVGVLWWATMYLSHHYLIDLTGGACLSVMVFYVTMPEAFKDADQINWTEALGQPAVVEGYNIVNGRQELDLDEEIRKLEEQGDGVEGDEEERIEASGSGSGSQEAQKSKTKKSRSVSWGETKVMGEEAGRAE